MRSEAEAIEAALTKHSHHGTSASWVGSPDPSSWRNIRPICRCNERILDGVHWTATEVAAAHRRHLVAAIIWELSRAEANPEPTP